MVSPAPIGHLPFRLDGAAERNVDAVALAQQLAGSALKVAVANLVCGAGDGQ
jgi:hypothetical protein